MKLSNQGYYYLLQAFLQSLGPGESKRPVLLVKAEIEKSFRTSVFTSEGAYRFDIFFSVGIRLSGKSKDILAKDFFLEETSVFKDSAEKRAQQSGGSGVKFFFLRDKSICSSVCSFWFLFFFFFPFFHFLMQNFIIS